MIFRHEPKLKKKVANTGSQTRQFIDLFFHVTVRSWSVQSYGKSSASSSHSKTQVLFHLVAPSSFKVTVFQVWVTSKSTSSLKERENRGRQGQSTLFLRWSHISWSQHFSYSITQNSATWLGRCHRSWRLPEILRCDYRCHSDWLSNHQK